MIPSRVNAVRSLATGVMLRPMYRDSERLLPLETPQLPHGDTRIDATPSIAQWQRTMAAGTWDSQQLSAALIRRITDESDPLHSVVAINPEAMREAQSADQRRAAGESGPLLGIPITLKDNIETAGPMPTTGGAEILLDHRPDQDAPIVRELRAAGAVILGKANLSELAGAVVRTPGFSAVAGQTRNPRGASFTPGGSSSGSAAGVAAGLAGASVGTETAGSLIAPAAFCGVVAVKPSRGVLPTDGIIPLVRFQDTAGPVARSVADAAALLEVMSRAGVVADGNCSLRGVRVGVLAADIETQKGGLEYTSDGPQVRQRIEERLRAAGAAPVDASPPAAASTVQQRLLSVVFGGLAHDTVNYLRAAGAPITTLADLQAYNLAKPRRRMPRGQALLNLAILRWVDRADYEQQAMALRRDAADALDAIFRQAGTELLVSVSNLHSALYASAGYPAVTIPSGVRRNGMPLGLTLIGPMGSDAWLLGMAAALEAVAP